MTSALLNKSGHQPKAKREIGIQLFIMKGTKIPKTAVSFVLQGRPQQRNDTIMEHRDLSFIARSSESFGAMTLTLFLVSFRHFRFSERCFLLNSLERTHHNLHDETIVVHHDD